MKKLLLALLTVASTASVAAQTSEDTVPSGLEGRMVQTRIRILPDVVVTGTRTKTSLRYLPSTVTYLNRQELTEQNQPSILSTLSQQVPGFFATSRGVMGYGVSGGAAGAISLRGISGSGGQMLVLIDGHPQYSGIYGHPIADSYQTLMAERVEVLHGPASVLYGSNAMGGVVNIVTRGFEQYSDTNVTHINIGGGSYGTVQTEASYQERRGRLSITAAAQYNRSDNHRPRMGYELFGGYFKLGYDLSYNWNVYFDADFSHFNASHPDSVQNPIYSADQNISRGVVRAGIDNHYWNTNGSLSVYSNMGQHRIDDGTHNPAEPTTKYFRSKDALTGVSWYQSMRLFEGNNLTVGFDYQNIYGKAYYTDKATGAVLQTPQIVNMKQAGRSHRDEFAGYVDVRQDIFPWLTLDAGIRYDYLNITGDEWIPQVGVAVRTSDNSTLKALASKGFRNPTMREMYLYPPSNEELEPERLWNYELSWQQRLGAFSYGANIFYIKGDNMIQTVNRQNVNTGEIENYGAEVNASYSPNRHWSFSTNHSYLHMEHVIAYAPAYKGFLGVRFNGGRWTAHLNAQYVNNLTTRVTPVRSTDSFVLLGASLSYQANSVLQLWARGENLLAQDYEIMYGFPMPKATFMAGINLCF